MLVALTTADVAAAAAFGKLGQQDCSTHIRGGGVVLDQSFCVALSRGRCVVDP